MEGFYGDEETDIANAHLCAAAPRMLTLLREARQDLEDGLESEHELEAEHSKYARKLIQRIDEVEVLIAKTLAMTTRPLLDS